MEAIPWHPLLVHFPLALAGVLPFIAIAVIIGQRQFQWPASSWVLVAGLQLFTTAMTYVAMEAGETDEHRVGKAIGKKIVHQHEEQAEMLAAASVAATCLAVATIFIMPKVKFYLMLVSLLLLLGQTALAWRTGGSGGELIYVHRAANVFAPAIEANVPVTTSDAHASVRDENEYSESETTQDSEESDEEEED